MIFDAPAPPMKLDGARIEREMLHRVSSAAIAARHTRSNRRKMRDAPRVVWRRLARLPKGARGSSNGVAGSSPGSMAARRQSSADGSCDAERDDPRIAVVEGAKSLDSGVDIAEPGQAMRRAPKPPVLGAVARAQLVVEHTKHRADLFHARAGFVDRSFVERWESEVLERRAKFFADETFELFGDRAATLQTQGHALIVAVQRCLMKVPF